MAEGARLESVYTGNRIEGSNPSPSAIFLFAEIRHHSKNHRVFAMLIVSAIRWHSLAFAPIRCYSGGRDEGRARLHQRG